MPETVRVYPALDVKTLTPPLNAILVVDGAGLEKMKKSVAKWREHRTPLGFDTETAPVHDFWHRYARSLQLGDKEEQYVIDFLAFAGSKEKLIASQGLRGRNNGNIYKPVLDIIDPVLCSNDFLKVGQNLAFEYEVMFWNFGRRIWHLFSTDLAERVIQAGAIHLKKYSEFSMESLVQRYFGMTIDKTLQQSFDYETPLTPEQITYAALDVRLPLALRLKLLQTLTADQLLTTTTIENDVIGTFVEMHVIGMNLDDAKWLARVEKTKQNRIKDLKALDQVFVPIVGVKTEAINDAEIARREKIWKEGFEQATPAETEKAAELRAEKDKDKKAKLRIELDALKTARKQAKAKAREAYSELSKDRTKKKAIIEKCEGDALLNYASNPQLLEALQKIKGFEKLTSVADDFLLQYNDREFIRVLRRYRKGKKETGTYGESWTQKWVTKPCAKEGWRHPGDGRLHSKFNQLEAETGRTSSEQPNGQNLPHEDDVRACFICDPPDESVRISVCCDSDTTQCADGVYLCDACKKLCETKAEEYCIVTCDMSGAELRIIAELADAQSWITAFAKGQDVHSVSTEILYPDRWPKLAVRSILKPDGWTLADSNKKTGEKIPLFNEDGTPVIDKETGKQKFVPPCAYFAKLDNGEYARLKCECPEHKKLRDGTKATNFLLCYGGGPDALADAIGVTLQAAKDLMALHESKFPDVWAFLRRSGELAQKYKEARDMFGRRRLFPEPTEETARQWYIDNEEERLELDEMVCEQNIIAFKQTYFREPNKEEMWSLTHRMPNEKDIRQAYRAMMGSMGRKGKNHPIQGTNASIIKRAMGCGFDKNGTPYLWHTLPKYKARIQNMVHDELVVHCPKRYGKIVLDLVGDAFKRAAAEVMHKVIMEFDGHIADRWMK